MIYGLTIPPDKLRDRSSLIIPFISQEMYSLFDSAKSACRSRSNPLKNLNSPYIRPYFNIENKLPPTFSEGVATLSLQTFQTRDLTGVRKHIPKDTIG